VLKNTRHVSIGTVTLELIELSQEDERKQEVCRSDYSDEETGDSEGRFKSESHTSMSVK
jgi:hypothetical protein